MLPQSTGLSALWKRCQNLHGCRPSSDAPHYDIEMNRINPRKCWTTFFLDKGLVIVFQLSPFLFVLMTESEKLCHKDEGTSSCNFMCATAANQLAIGYSFWQKKVFHKQIERVHSLKLAEGQSGVASIAWKVVPVFIDMIWNVQLRTDPMSRYYDIYSFTHYCTYELGLLMKSLSIEENGGELTINNMWKENGTKSKK